MRNSIRIAAASAAALAASFASTAYAADTATANATAEVLSTISVNKTQDLLFGQIAVNGNGNLVIGADGTITCPAALVCTGVRQPAAFNVTGTNGVGVSASVNQTSVTLTHATNPARTFTLDNFTVLFPLGTTLVGGAADFNVGGTLHVTSANAEAGVYNGSFDVTVEYQ